MVTLLEKQYELYCRTPFITVKVEPELGTMNLHCRPNIFELHTTISRCFDKIIKVGSIIPKIENILFPELGHTDCLFPISRYEDTVKTATRVVSFHKLIARLFTLLQILSIISDVLDVIIKHMNGPDSYLKCYNDLLYIISGVAEEKLNHFFSLEPTPLLREFEHQIRAYDNLRKEISMFRCKVSL